MFQQPTNKSDSETTENNFAVKINRILNGEKSVSYSLLSSFLKSPKHLYNYLMGDKEQTKAMIEGIRFHIACLEPDLFKEKYWCLDDTMKVQELINSGSKKPRATKEYKDWVIEQESKNKDKEMIPLDEYESYINMRKALINDPYAGKIMKALTSKEQKYTFEYDGFSVVVKIDGEGELEEYGTFTMDLKKVADSVFKRIKWDIKDMNYDMQGAMYSRFKGVNSHLLIYIDKGLNIQVVRLTEDTLEQGWNKFEVAVDKLSDCAKEGVFNTSYNYWTNGIINF